MHPLLSQIIGAVGSAFLALYILSGAFAAWVNVWAAFSKPSPKITGICLKAEAFFEAPIKLAGAIRDAFKRSK